MTSIRTLAVFAIAAAATTATFAATAQVRVLGPPPEPKVEWLKSPMVLEVAMPVADFLETRGGWTSSAATREFTGYSVNGVRLDELTFEIDARRDGCSVTLVTQAIVEPGHDKDVVLSFEVLRGEESVWTYSTREWGIDSGSSSQRTWDAGRKVSPTRCREIAEADGLVLQVTFRVANDL